MHIVVIGAGYVGLVTGASLARLGPHRVTLVEKDPARLDELRRGIMPIAEPGLGEAFREAGERIGVAGAIDEVEPPDFVFVAVATPISEAGDPDMTQLRSAAEDLRAWPDTHVSIRSTLPPGMSLRLPALFGRAGGSCLSTNPEFLRQGSALADFARPSRIVIGRYPETTDEHMARLGEILAPVHAPRLDVDVTAAELIKNVSNGFLALRLSFVNEVATLAEEFGVDVDDVLHGIALDPRIGPAYLRPGLGFGGSCIPKELQVLTVAGRRHGIPMHIARAVAQVNMEQQDRFIRRILRELPATGARVGLLGLSFKADTDDLRGSPALYVARRLLDADHLVTAFDPAVRRERAERAAPGICMSDTPEGVFDDAEAVVVATEWPEFAQIDLAAVRSRVARAVILDGRGIIDPERAVRAGFSYRGIGRPAREPSAASVPAHPGRASSWAETQ
jgi:UDPglucose 6-dehydrogenase